MTLLTEAQVRRRYIVLHGMRWLPVGLLIPIIVLLMLERGLTLGEVGLVAVAQGAVVLLLEVPTGGLADTLGRRPVLLLAGVVGLVSVSVLAVADTFWQFMLVGALQGVFRALDSGPLEAWYVDAVLAADPRARIEGGLSGAGVVLSSAIAIGALGSSGLVALHPVRAMSALTLPVLIAVVVQLVGIVAVAVLVKETPRHRDPGSGVGKLRTAVGDVPAVIGRAAGLLRRSRVLLALVVAELLWGVGAVSFETLTPPRMSEVVGDLEAAAAIMGPAWTAAWLASALGAGLVPMLGRLAGTPVAAAILRVGQGATVLGMAFAAGWIGVVAAFVATYLIHGASNPLHQTMVHRQVDGDYRATVLSLNSLTGQLGLIVGALVLTNLADANGVPLAMVVGAVVLASAAPLYLIRSRTTATPEPATQAPAPGAEPVGPAGPAGPA